MSPGGAALQDVVWRAVIPFDPDRVGAALSKANKNVSKAIDSGDADKLQQAIADYSDAVADAVDS